ncbi:MerR family transcriptional regulator [Thermosediminibacter litoriperuensis]|uniref:MerR family glutamine synthetase transcriptional repressor n=1 Tax=Thermosediminibacter litoriperuensis TaxID=291989 RepID=A0A5S5AYB7_9FIRM|nr:MerR family transcriptional regulator [Thermosediminibacter litoriperuensis]TYP57467.1 MerR family glutamine synthetase transcriptional repressor [Thermosediminibacter litoriperuensis]
MTSAEKDLYPIGTVEKKTGLSARQIRYYESMGLVNPVRTNGGQRRYTENDVLRLIRIKQMRDSGFDLKSIKEKIQVFEQKLEEISLPSVNPAQVKLSSLYPVSNRAVLMKLLEKK